MDRLEEGPETGEAGANDAEREFGVSPDTCGCVVPLLDGDLLVWVYWKGVRGKGVVSHRGSGPGVLIR